MYVLKSWRSEALFSFLKLSLMLFKVKPCLISRVSEDRRDVHGDKCRLNREVPHEPEPPRETLPPGCCVYATIVRLTNELPAPSAATGHLLREQMTSTVQCLCVQRSLPSLLDKPSSGVGEVMGPEPSVKAPATSTSFQYRVHKAFLYVPNEGLLGA